MSICICFEGDLHPDCRAPNCVAYRAQRQADNERLKCTKATLMTTDLPTSPEIEQELVAIENEPGCSEYLREFAHTTFKCGRTNQHRATLAWAAEQLRTEANGADWSLDSTAKNCIGMLIAADFLERLP